MSGWCVDAFMSEDLRQLRAGNMLILHAFTSFPVHVDVFRHNLSRALEYTLRFGEIAFCTKAFPTIQQNICTQLVL